MWKLTSAPLFIEDIVNLIEARRRGEDKTFHRSCQNRGWVLMKVTVGTYEGH